jgi:hypothetical protein
VGPRTSQALNRYSYVLNNPLRYTDPTGFETNELPVIVYDSWYGGYAPSGSSARFVAPSYRGCSADGIVCITVEPDLNSPYTDLPSTSMSAEFRFFLMRTVLSAPSSVGTAVEFGKGLLLGGIAGAVPFLGLVPPPEGQTEHFYLGYASALFAWGGVELIGGGLGLLGGGGAAVGGTAVAGTGIGAPVGAPVAVVGGTVAVASTASIVLGVANLAGALNVVQMANQAGSGGSLSSPSSGSSDQRSYSNNYPDKLAAEQAAAAKAGTPIVRAGDPDFEKVVNSGTVKFVVTEGGDLIVAPHTYRGHEVTHAVLAGGRPVLTAGQAEIAGAGGKYFGISISNHSGHYMPSARSLSIAREAFARAGVVFP